MKEPEVQKLQNAQEGYLADKESAIEHFKKYFPHESYREGQEEALEEIAEAFVEGHKYVVLDAPTGAGKSAINTAFARGFAESYYTTPQNALVDQIEEDDVIGKHYAILKGKKHYRCQNEDCKDGGKGPHNADECLNNEDNRGEKDKWCCDTRFITEFINDSEEKTYHDKGELNMAAHRDTTCPYPRSLWSALQSSNLLTNTWLFSIAPFFWRRDLAVIDESHNLEEIIFNFVDISITVNTVPFYSEIANELPQEDPEELEQFVVNDLREICQQKLKQYRDAEDQADQDVGSEEAEDISYEEEIEDIEDLQDKIDLVEEIDEQFVIDEPKNVEGVVLKPLYAKDYFQKKIKPRAERFLLSSATFTKAKESLGNLGVDSSDIKVVSMESNFPVENRRIYIDPVTNLKSSELEDGDYEDVARKILELMKKYRFSKGIAHCVSYDRLNIIYDYLEEFGVADRVLKHESSDEGQRKVEKLKESDKPYLLLSVGLEEGISLEDDTAQYNILVKTPNKYGDARVSYRIQENDEWDWYYRQTAVKASQAYGRTTRSKKDESDTYILDKNMLELISEGFPHARDKFPDWFLEAI